jgi:hypothetical protein
VKRRRNSRWLPRHALVGFKLAHDTADVLTLETRRTLVASLFRRPRPGAIRTDGVIVDIRPAARALPRRPQATDQGAPGSIQFAPGVGRISRVQGNARSGPRHCRLACQRRRARGHSRSLPSAR